MARGYPLDLTSPARHAATEIERAAGAALSVSDIAATYKHPISADLARVRRDQQLTDDAAAVEWLIGEALSKLTRRGAAGRQQLIANGAGYRFAEGITFDDLRYDGKKLIREFNPHSEFGDPFNAMSGQFSDNIGIASRRMDTRHTSLAELRESLRRYGWRRELPGVRDENGTLIIGHRRWALADELGIPVSERPMMTVTYGDGDEADRQRIIAAVASQVGYKAFTDEEWKRVARYLRAQGETIQAIADVLEKPMRSVHEAVKDFSKVEKSKGKGRPRNLTDAEQEAIAHAVIDEGKSIAAAEAEIRGWDKPKATSTESARLAVNNERARRQALADALIPVTPPPARRPGPHRCPICGEEHGVGTENPQP